MRHQSFCISAVTVLLTSLPTWSATREESIAALRAGLAEVGRQEIARSLVPEESRRALPDPYETGRALRRAPRDLLLEAIDKGIRGSGEEEFIGTLSVYQILVIDRKEPLHPEYHPLLLDRLKRDDFHSRIHTGILAGTLMLYRSRETVLALMDAAVRETDPVERNHLVDLTAGMIHLDLPVSTETTALQEQRMLDDFEAWFAANKDRIRFDKDGQPYLAGGEAKGKRVELSPEDRARIRKDPVCVVRLMGAMMGESDDEVMNLNARCGEALLGTEGASLMRKAEGVGSQGKGPSLDFQAAMASARGKYPSLDAVQLAIAYMAAYQTDQDTRKLAREMLDELGSADMARVLKGEPREVRKKARELGDEVLKEDGD